MHNLVIDIGNTNSKLAVFKGKLLVFFQSVPELNKAALAGFIKEQGVEYAALSSVRPEDPELISVLKANTKYLPFSTRLNTGVQNHYQTLSTLGQDRWAKIIAVHQGFPGQNCLVIDAGTCITYDLLDDQERYFGGSISLGVQMRFQALHHFTGKLPLVAWNREVQHIPDGISTDTAITNGVLQGVVNEVEGFIALHNNKHKNLKVVITGGDAAFLLDQLKNSIYASQISHDPYLVLKGLNEVIAFEYVQKD